MKGLPGLRLAGVRLWRLAALLWGATLIRWAAPSPTPPKASAEFGIEQARVFFPGAQSVETLPSGGSRVYRGLEGEGEWLGTLLSTSPEGDRVVGYAGSSRLLVALNPEGRIEGTQLISSGDTPAHVRQVRGAASFFRQLKGWRPMQDPPPRVEGVAGSTLTSLALVEAIQARFSGKRSSLRFPEPIALGEVQYFFPEASAMEPRPGRLDWLRVTDASGRDLGSVLRTSPESDGVSGYAGPSESLVAVEPDGETLRGVRFRKSFDTEEYVQRVKGDRGFWALLSRWKVSEWPSLQYEKEGIEGVAGATMTSYALAEGLKRRMAAERRRSEEPVGGSAEFGLRLRPLGLRDWVLLGMLVGAALMSFSGLRGVHRVRWGWQLLLVGGMGLWLGQFVSLGLLVGWARSGVPWSSGAALVALVAFALLVPWGTQRQVYCHQLCPQGAAQEWLGRFASLHRRLPARWHERLQWVPGLTLAAGFCAALWWPRFDLGRIEPFDAWVLGTASVVPALLALVGLGLSLFVPQAYCRYGCPTGALLKFVRSTSHRESLGLRDALAAGLLGLATVGVWIQPGGGLTRWVERSVAAKPSPSSGSEIRGAVLGTGWSVKLREAKPVEVLEELRKAVEGELERLESTLSPWRSESATRLWNESGTTLEMEVPGELFELVQASVKWSEKTGGAYDITVAPLISVWGFGPEGPVDSEPTEVLIQQNLQHVGWQKIRFGADGRSLQKEDPSLRIVLPLLQGYAVDRVFELLQKQGIDEFLVELGGELRAAGRWRVGIENPRAPERSIRMLDLENEALATSGLYRSKRRIGGREVSHVISPKTGRPLETPVLLCSVRGGSCLEAKGAVHALICLSPGAGGDFAAREHWPAFWVMADGQTRETGDWPWVQQPGR